MTSKLEAVHLGRLDWRATPKDQQCQAVRRLRRHVYFTSAKLLDFMPPPPVCIFMQPLLLSFFTASAFEVPPSSLPVQTSCVHAP